MTLSFEVQFLILEAHTKGLSGAEIQEYLKQYKQERDRLYRVPCTKTIYKYQKALGKYTSDKKIDELIRQQELDIAGCKDEKTRMKIRHLLIIALLRKHEQKQLLETFDKNSTDTQKDIERIIKISEGLTSDSAKEVFAELSNRELNDNSI